MFYIYAIDAARALGASRVVYLDTPGPRLDLAADLGADVLDASADQLPARGSFPITADFSATAEGLRTALTATAPGGHCTHAAPLFGPDVPLPLLAMYTMGVHLHTSRAAARPAIPAILALVAAGRMHPERVTTATVDWADAATELLTPRTKTVVTR